MKLRHTQAHGGGRGFECIEQVWRKHIGRFVGSSQEPAGEAEEEQTMSKGGWGVSVRWNQLLREAVGETHDWGGVPDSRDVPAVL